MDCDDTDRVTEVYLFFHGFLDDEADSDELDCVFHHFITYDIIYITLNYITIRPMEGNPKDSTAYKTRFILGITCEE